MTKTIRKTLPRDVSLGILIIIFGLVFFLSGQLFETRQSEVGGLIHNLYFGEFLVSTAVIIMVLILWEELLFPVKILPADDGLVFRNHRTKLKIQAFIYLTIPVIVVFLYSTFEVNLFRFFAWAGVCLALPVAGKLVSGINNYNDFLKLTGSVIEYKNNELEGAFVINDIKKMELTKDDTGDLQKLNLDLANGDSVIIDLDEMELEAYYESIEEYIHTHYSNLLK
ncbi:heavy metal transporter [Marinoscillum sp. MHG1-6]|uniref:heavy metal transporter n=1 Tax=Marinoscillum sp. MHG1-6 TaxID=2959627 RepID=UPI00215741B3|nr:heavy metal transporter [Marinoscillum sp. MHG1-6]